MNFYDYIYDAFKEIPFDELEKTNASFSTLISNKQIIVNEFFMFGLHPEDTEPFNEWCLEDSSVMNLDSGNVPFNFLDNCLYSLSIGKFKRNTKRLKYGKVYVNDDCCIYFSDGRMTIYVSAESTEYEVPKTKDEWFNMTVLAPHFSLEYEDMNTVLKMIEIMPDDSSFELYTESWIYKKDVDK